MSRAPGAELDTGPTLPGWTLHTALAVTAAATFLAATAGTTLPGGLVIAVCLAIAASAAATLGGPGYTVVAISLIPTTIALLTLVPTGYTWRTPVLMITIHATVRLAWYVSVITPATRVELAVLAADARRSAGINLIGQAVALLAGALTTTTQATPALGWTGILGAAALLVLALALRTGARSWPDTDAD